MRTVSLAFQLDCSWGAEDSNLPSKRCQHSSNNTCCKTRQRTSLIQPCQPIKGREPFVQQPALPCPALSKRKQEEAFVLFVFPSLSFALFLRRVLFFYAAEDRQKRARKLRLITYIDAGLDAVGPCSPSLPMIFCYAYSVLIAIYRI